MQIGFNPNYPAYHAIAALEHVVAGTWSDYPEDIESCIAQCETRVQERAKSMLPEQVKRIEALLAQVRNL